jgi:hypothetical protein
MPSSPFPGAWRFRADINQMSPKTRYCVATMSHRSFMKLMGDLGEAG